MNEPSTTLKALYNSAPIMWNTFSVQTRHGAPNPGWHFAAELLRLPWALECNRVAVKCPLRAFAMQRLPAPSGQGSIFPARGREWKAAGSTTGHPPLPWSLGQAETQVVVPVLRLVPVAVRHPAVLRRVVPAPATVHAVRGLWLLTECCFSVWQRKRQLETPPAVANANNA